MSRLPSYYAAPDADERMRELAETLASFSGSTYDTALSSINAAVGVRTRSIPRYMIALDRSVIRLWGTPLLHKGKKARRG